MVVVDIYVENSSFKIIVLPNLMHVKYYFQARINYIALLLLDLHSFSIAFSFLLCLCSDLKSLLIPHGVVFNFDSEF